MGLVNLYKGMRYVYFLKGFLMAKVIEIRIHGRGGQGAVTAAELIAVSAFRDGKFTQAFPKFGPERRVKASLKRFPGTMPWI